MTLMQQPLGTPELPGGADRELGGEVLGVSRLQRGDLVHVGPAQVVVRTLLLS